MAIVNKIKTMRILELFCCGGCCVDVDTQKRNGSGGIFHCEFDSFAEIIEVPSPCFHIKISAMYML